MLVNLRFLDAALSRLQEEENDMVPLATDGQAFFYDPKYILREYKRERTALTRAYLHVLLHCVFRHMFVHYEVDQSLWNLACDIAVESCINSLNVRALTSSIADSQAQVCRTIQSKTSVLTAEKIYRYLVNNKKNRSEYERWQELFAVDIHAFWYESRSQTAQTGSNSNGDNRSQGEGEDSPETSEENTDEQGENQDNLSSNNQQEERSLCSERDWRDVAERMQVEMNSFYSQRQGYESGSMIQNLNEVNRERYDYSAFLRKFAVLGEIMKINDDEFDYVFYTYGLQLYENMPLIEPLEYKETKRIREFVIAIDTSGSVAGETVQRFIQKTYNILKSTESFFSKVNIHIIQCDATIQEDAKITSQEDFDRYLQTMKLRGFGGTDFRPVFSYVDKLIEQKEFQNLKGLIYFTDGYGTFPSSMPNYKTAFVFLREQFNNYDVPSWAIKLILEKEDL